MLIDVGAKRLLVVCELACCQNNPVGFEPTRGDPIGLAGRRLNRSAKVSLTHDIATPAVANLVTDFKNLRCKQLSLRVLFRICF